MTHTPVHGEPVLDTGTGQALTLALFSAREKRIKGVVPPEIPIFSYFVIRT
jgi:hypothetical protein